MHEIVHGITMSVASDGDEGQLNKTLTIVEKAAKELLDFYWDQAETFTTSQFGMHMRDVPCIPHYIYNYSYLPLVSSQTLNHSQGCMQALETNCGFEPTDKHGCIFYHLSWINIILIMTGLLIFFAIATAITLSFVGIFSAFAGPFIYQLKLFILNLAQELPITAQNKNVIIMAVLGTRLTVAVFTIIFYYQYLRSVSDCDANTAQRQSEIDILRGRRQQHAKHKKQYLAIGILCTTIATIYGFLYLLEFKERLIYDRLVKQIMWDHVNCALTVKFAWELRQIIKEIW